MARNIAENFNRLSRIHQRYIRQTDGPSMTYSAHELDFTFAKNESDLSYAEDILQQNKERLHNSCKIDKPPDNQA